MGSQEFGKAVPAKDVGVEEAPATARRKGDGGAISKADQLISLPGQSLQAAGFGALGPLLGPGLGREFEPFRTESES
jgi:hypothetical protein